MTDQPASVICPVCDAPNATRSLFCAECGASLTDQGSDTTSIGPSASTDSQSTAVIPPARSWSQPLSSSESASATSLSPAVSPLAVAPERDDSPYMALPTRVPESRRGFWLGVTALILFLIVMGMWIWGGVLAADTRDSIRDLFNL